MNLQNIISEIEKVDPEITDRLDTRRAAMRQFANIGGKIALAAVPALFGGMLNKAYGQSNTKTTITDVLNFALTLEYLESEFYVHAVKKPNLIPAGMIMQGITIIRDHELEHVTFLKQAIHSLGSTPVNKPTFDFTGGMGSGEGPFKGVFDKFALFLAVAQVLEDTGVRAYKGQVTNLMTNNAILTAAVSIHAVEARHASYLRKTRSEFLGDIAIRPWITGDESGGIGTAVKANYRGESQTTQAGVNIVNINGQSISFNRATEAFDEPLTMQEVLNIASAFIVS